MRAPSTSCADSPYLFNGPRALIRAPPSLATSEEGPSPMATDNNTPNAKKRDVLAEALARDPIVRRAA
jgi:hypothetical protein